MNRSNLSLDRRIRRKLLAWFRREKRALPWRGTTNPYRIWISEVMLQQTTVAAVRRRYTTFLRRFPDLASLARAREEAVLASWSGLGYYSRARNLSRAARRIVRDHGGKLPRDPAVLRLLPGFGPYTAAAVASLAFGAREPAAEANVTRVMSRVFAIGGRLDSRASRQAVLSRVREILPRLRPGDALAALMDLGQTVCLPRRPDCPKCPLKTECAARRRGDPEAYPERSRKAAPLRVHFAAALAESGGEALLVRRRSSYLDGLWQFPCAEAKTPARARRDLAQAIRPLGLRLCSSRPAASARHTVVNRRLVIEIYTAARAPASAAGARADETGDQSSEMSRWFRPPALARAAIPTLTRKIGEAAGFLPAGSGRAASV